LTRLPKPYFQAHNVTLYLGNSLEVLDAWHSQKERPAFDALVTDPPYSSGGLHAGDRQNGSTKKYLTNDAAKFQGATFSGDNRDQRSQLAWLSLWMDRARRLLRPSAYAFVFSDWRQLPLTTDAIQSAGFIWRGVQPWDKGLGSRAAHKGFLRHQCEYVTWATQGAVPRSEHGGPWPGLLRCNVNHRHKNHPCAKPVAMMTELLAPVRPGGTVLDLFAGGGATLAAAALTGRGAVGVEIDEQWAEKAAQLVERAAAGGLEAVAAKPAAARPKKRR
jgi:site-specific DNA-methyltransferase (adenine-specific)